MKTGNLNPTKIKSLSLPILISKNADFLNYSSQGNGSLINPFIIENLTIDGNGLSDCISIEQTNASFIIRNCYLFNGLTGIKTWRVTNGKFQNNTIENMNHGINVIVSQNITIYKNLVRNSNYEGMLIGSSENFTISNNSVITSGSDGIDLMYTNYTNVFDNFLTQSYHGISITGKATQNQIYNNTAFNNTQAGIYLGTSIGNNQIFKNFANNNSGAGISAYQAQNELIYNNTAEFNQGQGFSLSSSRNLTIAFNKANYNEAGIRATSNNSLVYNNTAKNNTEYGISFGGVNNRIINNTVYLNTGSMFFGSEGIHVSGENVTVKQNTANYNERGIVITARNGLIINNSINFNEENMRIYDSKNITLANNKLNGGALWIGWIGKWFDAFGIGGTPEEFSSYQIDPTNLVNGKPILYFANQTLLNLDNLTSVGQLILVNCNNSIISNMNISNEAIGITLLYSDKNSISNSSVNHNIYGIYLLASHQNNLSSVTANNASEDGIHLSSAHYNTLFNNTAIGNYYGINILKSNNTNLFYNNITFNSGRGLNFNYANNSNIFNNTIDFNLEQGVFLDSSYNNTLKNNTIANNEYVGVQISNAGNNTLLDNEVKYNSWGILLSFQSNNCTILRNFVYNNTNEGIFLSQSDHSVISNNSVLKNQNGIVLSSVTNNTVSHNNISNNRVDGIAMVYSPRNFILFNKIYNNSNNAIYLKTSSFNYIVGNILRNNKQCINESGCIGNIIEGNDCDHEQLVVLSPPQLSQIFPNIIITGIINLNWTFVAGANIYYIYRDTKPITSVEGLNPIFATSMTNYTDIVTSSGKYYYAVVAGNSTANSTISNSEGTNVVIDSVYPTSLALILLMICVSAVTAISIAFITIKKRQIGRKLRFRGKLSIKKSTESECDALPIDIQKMDLAAKVKYLMNTAISIRKIPEFQDIDLDQLLKKGVQVLSMEDLKLLQSEAFNELSEEEKIEILRDLVLLSKEDKDEFLSKWV